MFLQKLHNIIIENKLIDKGDTVVVAVSGGADSVSLLLGLYHFANVMDYRLIVCHVEHGLRGEESKEDARFVQALAEKLQLPFEIGEFDVNDLARRNGDSTQVTARKVRYDFLESVMHTYQANRLAVAHHADDQVETILMRVIRGTSTSGLAGMGIIREWRGKSLIRPLLSIWRREIEEFCSENKVEFRTDASNYSTKYLRNKIRLELIPLIEHAYNPNIKNRMIALGDIVRSEDQFIEQQAEQWMKSNCVVEFQGTARFSRESFTELHVALQRRVIKLILYYLSGQTAFWEFIHFEQVRLYLTGRQPNLYVTIAQGVQLRIEYDTVTIYRGRDEAIESPHSHSVSMTGSESFPFGPFTIRTEVCDLPEDPHLADQWEAFIRLDSRHSLTDMKFRTRLPGDTITLFGSEGSTKIKKLMIDHKIPRSLRDEWPILEVDNEVIWIPGVQRSRSLLIDAETQKVLYIRVTYHQ